MSAIRMLVKSSVDRFFPLCFTILSSTPLSFKELEVAYTVSSSVSACCRYVIQFLTIDRKFPTDFRDSCRLCGEKNFPRPDFLRSVTFAAGDLPEAFFRFGRDEGFVVRLGVVVRVRPTFVFAFILTPPNQRYT